MQNYVVGVRLVPVEKEWVWEELPEQDFSLYVSLSFSEILPEELEASGFTSFALIKGSLFYPFEIKGGAVSGLTLGATSIIAAISALLLF